MFHLEKGQKHTELSGARNQDIVEFGRPERDHVSSPHLHSFLLRKFALKVLPVSLNVALQAIVRFELGGKSEFAVTPLRLRVKATVAMASWALLSLLVLLGGLGA